MNGPPRTKTRIEMLSINGTTSFVVYMSGVDVSNLHHSSKSQKSSPSLDDLNHFYVSWAGPCLIFCY